MWFETYEKGLASEVLSGIVIINVMYEPAYVGLLGRYVSCGSKAKVLRSVPMGRSSTSYPNKSVIEIWPKRRAFE